MNIGAIIVSQFISFFFWGIFGFYLNKVVKHRYGKKEDCCYCLEMPNKKRTKTIPAANEQDTIESSLENEDTVEPVDDDLRSRPGIHIRSISKFFPSPTKGGQPIKAVDHFSVSMYEFQ